MALERANHYPAPERIALHSELIHGLINGPQQESITELEWMVSGRANHYPTPSGLRLQSVLIRSFLSGF